MRRTWLVALWVAQGAAFAAGTGTTAADYYRRAFQAADPAKRIALLDRALAINPHYVPALRHRSAVYSLLGEKERALADITRAAALVPSDPRVHFLAGGLAAQLKQYGKAVPLFERALVLEPKNAALRASLVDVLIKLRRIDEAARHADALVHAEPEKDYPYSVRAEAYEWADRYADAMRDLTVLVGRHPNDPKYYFRRCINYRCMGRPDEALADAERGLRLKGNTAYGFAARGCSYELLGRLEAALADYKRAAELDEDRRYYMIWSCIVLRKLDRRAEADKLIGGFLKQLKDEKWIAPVIRYLAGTMSEAEVFRLARHGDPEKNRQQLCEAYYYVGACHLADGKLDAAEALLKKCLAQRVNNFYEHGFALRDLRAIRRRRDQEKLKKRLGPK